MSRRALERKQHDIRNGTCGSYLWKMLDRVFVKVVRDSLMDAMPKDLINIVLSYANNINHERHSLAMKMIRDVPTVSRYAPHMKRRYSFEPLEKYNTNGYTRDECERVYQLSKIVNSGHINHIGGKRPIYEYESPIWNDGFISIFNDIRKPIGSYMGDPHDIAEENDCTRVGTRRRLGIIWEQILEDQANGIGYVVS